MKNVCVAGLGYVGTSMVALLCKNVTVTGYDIDAKKIQFLKNFKSNLVEEGINERLSRYSHNIRATCDSNEAFINQDAIIISVPTNYDEIKHEFDTSIIEKLIDEIREVNNEALLVIKSTIPVGFTERIKKKIQDDKIIFSPEFLREGKALSDNLYPERIVIGDYSNEAHIFGDLLRESSDRDDVPILMMSSTEAESVKLFANTFLALRIAFFNEIDSFCYFKKIDARNVITGMCHDSRIGNYYNNPSFGYGGYCLPKDTKQAESNFQGINQSIISSIIKSNQLRKENIAENIFERTAPEDTIGIYRLAMKQGSDNFRESAIIDLLKILSKRNKIIIYEPLAESSFMGHEVVHKIEQFKQQSNFIIANRIDEKLNDSNIKVFSRDIFNEN